MYPPVIWNKHGINTNLTTMEYIYVCILYIYDNHGINTNSIAKSSIKWAMFCSLGFEEAAMASTSTMPGLGAMDDLGTKLPAKRPT